MSLLRKFYLIVVVVVLLFFFILFFFFGTDRGVYLMLRTITDWVPSFKIGSIHGNWLHGVTLKDVYYQKNEISIRSSELYISVNLTYLWNKRFCINALFFKDFFVHTKLSKFNTVLLEVQESRRIARFIDLYSIVCHDVILNNIYLELDGNVVTLDKCSTGFRFHKGSFILFPTFFSGLNLSHSFNFIRMNIPSIKEFSLKNFSSYGESITQVFKYLFSRSFFEKKNMECIGFHHLILEGIEGENLYFGNQENVLIKRLRMQGIVSKKYIRLILLEVISSYGEMNITGNVKFEKKRSVSFFANFRSNATVFSEEERVNCIISGNINDILHIYFDFSGMLNAHLSVKLQLLKVGIPLHLRFNIHDGTRVPFIQGSDYFIRGLNFNLSGNLHDYHMDLKLVLCSSKLAFPIDLVMHSSGNVNSLVISNLQLRDKSGVLNVFGAVHWKDVIKWKIKLNLKDINFSQFAFIWPANFSGEITVHGSLFDGRLWKLKLFNVSLYGMMKDNHRINFESSLIRDSFDVWRIPQFFVSVGSNTLKISEDFKKNSLVTAIIQISSLNDLFPNLHGSIFGNINFYRSCGNSRFLMNIIIKSLYLVDRNFKIDRMIIESSLRYKNILQGNFEFQLDRLMYDRVFFHKMSCQMFGDINNHYIKFFVSTDLFNIMTKIRGSIDYICKNWQGNILNIDFVKNQMVNNHLDPKIMQLYYNLPNQFIFLIDHLDKYTLHLYCDSFSQKVGMKKFIHPFQNLHLVLQQSFISRSLCLKGKFNFFVDLIWNKDSVFPEGKMFLSGDRIEWVSVLFRNKSFMLFNNFILNFLLKEKHFCFDWSLQTTNYGQFYGKIKILLFDEYQFLGDVYTKNLALCLLNIFLTPSTVVDGVVNLHLKFNGNLLHPEIYGVAKLENIILQGDQIPFVMMSSKLFLNFTGNRATLNGGIDTTHGELYVSGNFYWKNIRSIYSHIRIIGHDVRLILSSTIQMDISPVIVFEVTPYALFIKGILDIPWANIELKEYLKNVVNISSDEVIITDNIDDSFYPWKGKGSSMFTNIITNVVVRFGNDVRVTSFGLDAKLHGDLTLIHNQYGLLELKGYVNILRGRFNAYGQSFFIKKGQLVFSGLVDDKPYLNVEVVHGPELLKNTSASGIRITGCVTSPQIEIFSDRSMSQEEAISYLLSGQKLDFFNVKSHDTIRSILIRLGLVHTDKLIKECGRILRVKDLILSTRGLGDKSQIVLSGYIAPGLQIRYGIGIFDAFATITARYCLLPNLYFEVVSGTTQIADLIYQFKY